MKAVEFADAGEGSPCPKRNWVLTTLSDDEALAPDGLLPPGLQFHLLRCPACRSDADRLLSVSDGLRKLSAEEPPGALLELADAQLAAALANGAALSGRATIPDDDYLDDRNHADTVATSARPSRLLFVGRYAAAAVIAFAVLWAGVAVLNRRSPRPVPYQPMVNSSPALRSRPASPAANDIPQPGEIAEDAALAGEPKDKTGTQKQLYCIGLPYISDDVHDDPNCVQRAFVLPFRDPGRSGPALGMQGLDRPPRPASNTRLPNER